jgi:hypothetical protein
MPVKSMKLTPSEAKEGSTPIADAPEFPFGLTLHLDDTVLEKLGLLDAMPEMGDQFVVLARAKVDSVSSHDSQGGERRSVTLQITDMGLTPNGGGKLKRAASTLYGGKG